MVRAVVLSAGGWSRQAHLPALRSRPDVELLAVTSPRPGVADSLAAEFGAGHAFTDWRRALDLGPDVVVVSSPPVAHVPQVLAAFDAGAHVLVEKPFAMDAADARTMVEHSASAGRSLLVGFGWCRTPVFRYASNQVRSGAVGSLEQIAMHLAVNIRALLTPPSGGVGPTAGESATYTDPRTAAGGSAAVTMSHQLGMACWIAGERIRRVGAFTSPPRSRMDLHTAVVAEFASGASAALSAASTQPDIPTPQWLVAIYGSEGQLRVDTVRNQARWVPAVGEALDLGPSVADGGYDSWAPTLALIAAAGGAEVPSGMSPALALHVVAVTDAVYASAIEGRMVEVAAS